MSTDQKAIEQDLKAIQGKRVYFGHQSVGANIVEGLKDILAGKDDPGLDVVKLGEPLAARRAVFIESAVGENRNPKSKCDDFLHNVEGLGKDSLDVALMKFCYVDIGANTNIKEIFDSYVATVDSMKAKYPNVRVVHVTAPLTSRISMWEFKRIARRILGREGSPEEENLRRNEYNEMLLQRYGNDPVFDLAKVESTGQDGKRETFERGGKIGYALVGSYTDDGGHLNVEGRRRAAEELLHTLAKAMNGGR